MQCCNAISQCLAGDRAIGSYITAFIYSKCPVSSFDAAISIERRLSLIRCITAGKYTIRGNHCTVSTNFDTVFTESNLIRCPFIHDKGISGCRFSRYRTILNSRFIFLENIFVIEGKASVGCFDKFCIRCHTACQFIGICCTQGIESSSHILVDGIEPLYHILVDLLNHLVLGFICTDTGSRLLCQGCVQFGHIVTDGVSRFYDSPILNGSVCLTYSFTQHVLFYIGNPFIQGIQVLAHGLRRLDRCPISGCSISNSSRCGNGSSGNAVTFNGGRGRSSTIIISKGCPGRFSSSNLGIFSCSISCSINNLSI